MRRLLVAGAVGIWLCGCAVGPDYTRPAIPTPPAFRGQAPDATAPEDGKVFGELRWWEVFRDSELQDLIRTAVINNYDVQIAAARVLQARAQVGIVRADQFPQVSAGSTAGRERLSANAFPPVPPTFPLEGNNLELSGSLSYEVDLWGGLRRATEAARAQLLASEEARATVLSTLVSDVATAYFQLRELDLELEIAERTLASRQRSLRLVTLRRDRGVASGLDVRQAEVLVYSAAAVVPDTRRQIEQKENQIRLLLGESPGNVARGRALTDQSLAIAVPPGLPSALLERRPDIRQAEARLIAANANIGVAKAQFFPQITLTASAGLRSAELSRLFEGPSGFWAFAGQLLQPVFQGGRIWFSFQAAKARQREALSVYQQTIETAFREVSDALIAHRRTREFRTELEALTASAGQYARLSTIRYRGGVSSYLEVLDADARLFSSELALAGATREELLAVVQLYKALGGGWQTAAAAAESH